MPVFDRENKHRSARCQNAPNTIVKKWALGGANMPIWRHLNRSQRANKVLPMPLWELGRI